MEAYYIDGGALVIDPNNPLVLWSGGTYGSMQVSKSTNGGTVWTRYTLNAAGYTYALAVDPIQSNIVYAGGNPGMYRTTNSGTNWTSCSNGLNGWVYDIVIDPLTTNTVYAGTPNGVFKSTNSGTTWTNTGCANVNALVLDPDNPQTLYAGTDAGVYVSTAGGGSWTAMNSGLDDTRITSLGIYPDMYLYCGTQEAGMYRWSISVGIREHDSHSLTIEYSITPNPVTGQTIIHYALPSASIILLEIYDIAGVKIACLVNGVQEAGQYNVSWNRQDDYGNTVPSGIYFSRLQWHAGQCVKKMVVVK